ncbi:MAG: orotate phosphoribosyltransferase [Gammaproteobacteria bacterium]
MKDYKELFIDFALESKVLRFGEFTLKSGRISPYFFDSGLFNEGAILSKLGRFYAEAIHAAGLEFDMLFGPAYKGIPLVSATAIAYAEMYDREMPYCFDRKEEKDHGEGGIILGAAPNGRVLIVDDVITAGTSVDYSVELLRSEGAQAVAVIIALDRQEQGKQGESAIDEIQKRHGLKVINIICLAELIEFMQNETRYDKELEQVRRYQKQYGITTG